MAGSGCPFVARRPDNRSGLAELTLGLEARTDVGEDDTFDLTVAARLRRRGVEAKLIVGPTEVNAPALDQHLIALVAQARLWFVQVIRGEVESVREIADRDGLDPSDVGRNLQLAFLAPDIVEAVLAGHQPVELTARRLKRVGSLPLEWEHQRRMLGFPT